jgi:PKD repeat protein
MTNARLELFTSPSGIPSGSSMLVPPAIRVLNADGSVNTSQRRIEITPSVAGTLRGPTQALSPNGIATFRGLAALGSVGATVTMTAATAGFDPVTFSVTVQAAVDTFYRGCALPRATVDVTRLTYSGTTRNVGVGQTYTTMQAAANAAVDGDTIVLKDSVTDLAEEVVWPARAGTGWVLVRSETMPCAVDVRCKPSDFTTQRLWRNVNNNGSALVFANGAARVRFEGIRFGASAADNAGTLVFLGNTNRSSSSHHLILDRCFIRGSDANQIRRGVRMDSGNCAVINSHIDKFWDASTDAQAILVLDSTGVLYVNNCYLEAVAECFMSGGASTGATTIPCDLTFTRNVLSKPLAWKGLRTNVKNLFELKTMHRALVEGNIFDGTWSAAQYFAFTVKTTDQDGANNNGGTSDAIFRNNFIRNVGAVWSLSGNPTAYDTERMSRVCIRNNLGVNINSTDWSGPGNVGKHAEAAAAWDVEIDHNTFVTATGRTGMFISMSSVGVTMGRFLVTNNLSMGVDNLTRGDAIYSTMNAISASDQGFGATFEGNALIGINPNHGNAFTNQALNAPASNRFTDTVGGVAVDPGFANYGLQSTADTASPATVLAAYTLASGALKNGAVDGQDVGVADWATLSAAIANVLTGGSGTIPNVKPTAAFTITPANLTIACDSSASTDDTGITSRAWTFGDGGTGGNVVSPSHTYASGGTYLVTLTVTDGGALTDTITHGVTVAPPVVVTPPVVDPTAPASVAIISMPATLKPGRHFTVVAEARNADGTRMTSYTGPLTITVANATLGGTTTVLAVNGVATFTKLLLAHGTMTLTVST